MKLVFATNNNHKLHEIEAMVDRKFQLLNLNDINCREDIPEDQDTLEGNASRKASYIYNKFRINCFADDTGLEIEALGNEPGVFSARYAGEAKDSDANIEKVLDKLSKINNRKARFRTVISLILDGREVLFEGVVTGTILHERRGSSGFGYDPVFLPDGYAETFAEMDLERKNAISHRGRAVMKLVAYLNNYLNKDIS